MRFTTETPDDSLFNDFKSLNELNDAQVEEFLGLVLGFLGGQSQTEFMEAVAAFAEQNGCNINALKSPLRGTLIFFKGAIKANLTPNYVRDDLVELGLDASKAAVGGQLWKKNFLSISRAVSEQTLSVNELVDLDWRFGIASSSSDLFRVGSTFLQLKLVLNKGKTTEPVYMELSLKQFYKFMHELEKAKTSLDFFQ